MKSANGTELPAYTDQLKSAEVLWKRLLGVQKVYAWNLRRLQPGFLLDVGCGIGRNLRAVRGHGVGVDHNAHSVAAARERGFEAYTPEGFSASIHARPERFDSLLFAHVLEHLSRDQARALLATYLPYVKRGGRVIAITPQERGFQADATHCTFVDFAEAERLCREAELRVELRRSFPFPRVVGRWFRHNEFVTAARKS